MEEERLVPEKKVLYQFSARGHDMAQVLRARARYGPGSPRRAADEQERRDLRLLSFASLAVVARRRRGGRPWFVDGRAGGYSNGRDIGVAFNYPSPAGASALPMCGGVGAQYTPMAGWAQAMEYHRSVLGSAA